MLSLGVIIIATPFHFFEWLFFRKKIGQFKSSEPPLFILGHWRSGTTYLHNLLCCDPLAGFMTTYHSVWPNNLASSLIFKTFMATLMPNKRPADDVELNVEFPQEEEFAISNVTPYAYYHFWYFPSYWREYYQKYVRFQSVNKGAKNEWKASFSLLVKKALINTNGQRAVFKNPVNTARINPLLEIYPEARFIFIHRNPVIVYLSSKRFFLELFPTLYFQKVSDDQVCEMILATYVNLMNDYFDQKSIIDSKHIIEIRYTDFEADPLNYLKSIYEDLGLIGWKEAEPKFQDYIESQRTYEKKKSYAISQKELDIVLDKWGFAMKKWGYVVPENLEVIPSSTLR